MFLASSFEEAEFYGRPLDQPKRVRIANPLVGDEASIHLRLFGTPLVVFEGSWKATLRWRFALDAKMKRQAIKLGYDSIVILSPIGFNQLKLGKIPRSIELNVFVAL